MKSKEEGAGMSAFIKFNSLVFKNCSGAGIIKKILE